VGEVRLKVVVLAILGTLVACGPAVAAPFGADDTTFSGDGWVALTSGTDHAAEAMALERQPDGALVSAGFAMVGAERRIALTRHTSAGDLDPGFGTGGSTLVAAGNAGEAIAKGIHRRPDGSFLVAAEVVDSGVRKLGIGTFTQSGLPGGGFTLHALTIDGDTRINGTALTAGGDILVTGSARDGAAGRRAFVARLTPAGAVVWKRLLIVGDGTSSAGEAVREEPSGRISVLGGARDAGIGKAFAVRLTAGGVRDASFGTNGGVLFGLPGRTFTIGAGNWGSGGRHIIGGESTGTADPSDFRTLLIRLHPDGSPDTGFSGDGVLEGIDPVGNVYGVHDLAELPDGRTLFAANALIGSLPIVGGFGAGLVTAAGVPDPSFGGDGFRDDRIGTGKTTRSDGSLRLAVDGNTFVLAGWVGRNIQGGVLQESHVFALARYDLAGARTDLALTILGETSTVSAADAEVTADGSVFVAGEVVKGTQLEWSVWKLTSAGVPDTTWSSDGLAANALPEYGSSAMTVLPTAGGTVYAGGISTPGSTLKQATVVRYLADGTLDPAFGGGDGIVTFDIDGASNTDAQPTCTGTPSYCRDDDATHDDASEISHLVQLADGDLMVVGYTGDEGTFDQTERDRMLLVRLNPDGTQDAAFGTGGIVQISRSGAFFTAPLRAAEIPAGKLLVPTAYSVLNTGGGDPTLLRFDAATGALDAAFDGDGHASIAAPGIHSVGANVFGDGSVMTFSSKTGGHDLHRFTASGAQDGTFGNAGVLTHTNQALGASLNPVINAQLPDGTIVTAASTLTGGSPRPAQAFGFTPAGAVRADFGANGLLGTARSCGTFVTRALAAAPGGKLVVVGVGHDPVLAGAVGVSRYTDGAPGTPIGCPPTGGFASITGSAPYTCAPTGTLGGSTPFTFAYQWVREATAIPGATSATYTATADDAGHKLTCRITVSNAYGSRLVGGNVVTVPGTPYVETEDGPPPVTPDPDPEPTASPSPEPTAQPQPPAATPIPSLPKPVFPAPLPALKGSAAFTLPSAKKCVSRRRFRIRLKNPKGTKLVSAVVKLNGKKVKSVKGKRLSAPVDLRGLPKGRFTVKVEAVTADGRKVSETRRYRTCAPRKRT
jgi:uncharacterized delta-60 repeat protein